MDRYISAPSPTHSLADPVNTVHIPPPSTTIYPHTTNTTMSTSSTSTSTTNTSTTSSTVLSTNPDDYLPTFDFDIAFGDLSSFDENFITKALEFDTAMGFKPVSPCIHPRNPDSWLAAIPTVDQPSTEMQDLASRAQEPGPKTILLKDLINYEETVLHHIKENAKYYTTFGPAPMNLEERNKSIGDASWVCYLIYLQVIFFGDISLTPWQTTFYYELAGDVLPKKICPICKMIEGPWCQEVVQNNL